MAFSRTRKVAFLMASFAVRSFGQQNGDYGKWVDTTVYRANIWGDSEDWDGVAGFSFQWGGAVTFDYDFNNDLYVDESCYDCVTGSTYIAWGENLCYEPYGYGFFYPIAGAWISSDVGTSPVPQPISDEVAGCTSGWTPAWSTSDVIGWTGAHEMAHVLGFVDNSGSPIMDGIYAGGPKGTSWLDEQDMDTLYQYSGYVTCS
jgi:hypothetical protein